MEDEGREPQTATAKVVLGFVNACRNGHNERCYSSAVSLFVALPLSTPSPSPPYRFGRGGRDDVDVVRSLPGRSLGRPP